MEFSEPEQLRAGCVYAGDVVYLGDALGKMTEDTLGAFVVRTAIFIRCVAHVLRSEPD